MLAVLGFVAVLALVTGLIHLYLWKRLVRDTTAPGRWRRIGGVAALVLALLVPVTLRRDAGRAATGSPGRATCGSR